MVFDQLNLGPLFKGDAAPHMVALSPKASAEVRIVQRGAIEGVGRAERT